MSDKSDKDEKNEIRKDMSVDTKHINTNISSFFSLINLKEIRREIVQNENSKRTILRSRQEFIDVLNGKDDRFVVITGPCSIHDIEAAEEYALRLKKLIEKTHQHVLIFMRVYFEKPRTIVGWKGLINDPNLDGSFQVEEGLKRSRKMLINLSDENVYAATEMLDPITAAYLAELVGWAAIGARTTESQIHREMVSGLSVPVGFKNGTNGNLDVAMNAMRSSAHAHRFLGIDDEGRACIVKTSGNKHTHIVLRGGVGKPNYSNDKISVLEGLLDEQGLAKRIMVDCSHDNSGKNHERQKEVVRDILKQKENGNKSIFGIMLESNLKPGNQKLEVGKKLEYGVSITDKCIGWEENEDIVCEIADVIKGLQVSSGGNSSGDKLELETPKNTVVSKNL